MRNLPKILTSWKIFSFVFLKDIKGLFIPSFFFLVSTLVNLTNSISSSGLSLNIALPLASCIFALWLIHLHIDRRYSLYLKKQIPFVLGLCPETKYRDMINEVTSTAEKQNKLKIETVEDEYNLEDEDWRFHRSEPLPPDSKEWKKTLRKVTRRFESLSQRVPGEKVYHFFLNCPATFALGLGALIGPRETYVAYHYQPGKGDQVYFPQIDFSGSQPREGGTHYIKTEVEEYRYINLELDQENQGGQEKLEGKGDEKNQYEENRSEDLYVAINLSGHSPVSDTKKLAQEKGALVAVLSSGFGGTIPLEEDWVQIVREINSRIEELLETEGPVRLHLFLSMPIVLAFALGASFGPFQPITVWHWYRDQKGYQKVFTLSELER